MTTKNRVLPGILFSLAAAFGSDAQAAQFSAVCSFGDSLSDAGYYRPFLRSIGIPESLVSQLGSFTTNPDPVWTELLAQFYGITPNPSNVAGGCIYAQGGARVTDASASTPPGAAQRPMSTQITEYLAANGGHADPNALYTVWIGANDFLQNSALFSAGAITQTQFQNNVLAAATAEVQLIGQLRGAGARYIMVAGMPNLGLTPASLAGGAAAAAGATQLAAGYNTTLWTTLAGAGIKVIPIDTFTLLNEIKANAASFGITNTTGMACGVSPLSGNNSSQFCLPNTLVAANANNTFLFADSVHPTGAVQAMLAQFAESMIEGPYNYGQLAEAPLRTRALHVQGVTEGLGNGHLAEVGKWTVFASGGGGNYDVDSFPGNLGVSHDNTAFTLGATIRTSESVTLGAAWGQTRTSGSFASSGGDYHSRDDNFSLFGSLKVGRFWATGVATVGNIKYNDIHRNIMLGPVLRTATASTKGSNASAFINAGYDFAFGRFLIGPTVGATFQDVEVSGFDEENAASNNLRIGTQTRRSQVVSAGLRASMDLGGWTPWIKVTADKENNNDERLINALPLTLATTNNNYDIAAFRGDTTFTTIAAGVRGWIMPNVGLGVSYYKVQGRSGISEQGASATVSVRF
jgi:outer membrane lipase/esterase